MIRIDLTNTRSRFLFLGVVLSLAGIIAHSAVRFWLAAHWDSSPKPRLWLKATRLESDNPSYWEHAALYELWDFRNGNPQRAAMYLNRAVEINPHSDKVWMELASADETLGDSSSARQAYEKAKQAHPVSADVAWRYGSFLLRQGDFVSGFPEIRRALAVEPQLTASAISACWKANPNIDAILNTALPAGSDYYVAAINFLLRELQLDAALTVWKRLLTLRQPVNMPQAIPLINALIDRNRIVEAYATWQQALAVNNWPKERNDDGSLIFNGGFENKIADGGFDWREQTTSGVSFALDKAVFHSGKQAIRVAFDGSANVNFAHLLQYVPVLGNQRYRFSAYVRTEGVTTDSGVRFFMYDPFHPTQVQTLTANMTGTNPWTPVNTELITAADTDLLVIALRRIPSWKFDNKLRGTVWVDDVRLVPLKQLPPGGSR